MSPCACKWRLKRSCRWSFFLWCLLVLPAENQTGDYRNNNLVMMSENGIEENADANISRKSFPAGFVFGTATSAYQVEGAVKQDGRGQSIWDTFSHRFGNVLDLTNGDITDDNYNRFQILNLLV
eukprot:c24186_g1_i4 orf=529-900(+)